MRRLGPLALALALSAGIASAGQGWYLLTPTLKKNLSDAEVRLYEQLRDSESDPLKMPLPSVGGPRARDLFDLTSPLRIWLQFGAYDSARECESTRSAMLRPAAEGSLRQVLYGSGLCVASDDPRLK